MIRKYLDDIGVKDRWDLWPKADDPRHAEWEEQRNTYGFDERETWSLDHAFYFWLYERLMMFKEVSIVNLEFHKFEYGGETLTQEQMIDGILERLRFSFSEEYNSFDEKQFDYVHEIEKMWAVVLPAMWW